MRVSTALRILGAGLVVGVALPALADSREWCLSAGGGASVTSARFAGSDALGLGYTFRSRIGRGVTDSLELGATFAFARSQNLEFSDAQLVGQSGTLFADLTSVAAGAELRFAPGVALSRAFEKTGPYLAARFGLAVLLTTSQQLFSPNKLLIVSPDDTVEARPFAAGGLGIEHRFGDHFVGAAELSMTFMAELRRFDGTLEFAWTWY